MMPIQVIRRPACHTWPVTIAEIDDMLADVRSVAPRLPESEQQLVVLTSWHGSRCALCGKYTRDALLINDHGHDTGLLRGLLCPSCNASEWRMVWHISCAARRAYQVLPPTAMLYLEIEYKALARVNREALTDSISGALGRRLLEETIARDEARRRTSLLSGR